MDSSSSLWLPTEEKMDESIEAERMGGKARRRRPKTSILIALIVFAGILGVMRFAKLSTPLLSTFSTKKHIGEETPYSLRGTSQGDQYLLGVGKADITGFVGCYQF